jgi:N-glycosylase/DNA lyase
MGVDDLVNDVLRLRGSEVRGIIERRMREFECEKDNEELFKELVFCILTANFSAEGSLRILESLGDDIFTLTKEELADKLAKLGHRYPRKRAEFIVEARKLIPILKDIISSFRDERLLREWLVKNVKGLGYKEASHFLRNIGFKNVSIIDFHILDLLVRYGILEGKPRNLNRAKYLMIESILEEISRRTGMALGELDLYLWYIETGKVLK